MEWEAWHLIVIGFWLFLIHQLITDEKFRHGVLGFAGLIALLYIAAWLLSECSWGGGGDPDRFRGWR